MNRDRIVVGTGILGQMALKQAAFHEAGHAAAIYLRNADHLLPQIIFRISLSALKPETLGVEGAAKGGHLEWRANLQGGLLLENPVLSITECHSSAYRLACEADVVNLLVGPLAEAKHVAQRDGEHFSRHLLGFKALQNYGGISDRKKVEEYLDGFGLPPLQRAETLQALYSAAFDFIDQASNWRAIDRLANYILSKELVLYEEAAAVLDEAIGKQY